MGNDVISFSEIEQRDVNWLCQPYIPFGRITILEGDPGQGKTWISLNLAASISKGRCPLGLHKGNECSKKPGNVLYISAEDSAEDTIKPRLESLKANMGRIYTVNDETAFNLEKIVTLREYFEAVKPKLFVIDPIQAFIKSTGSASKIRPVLHRISNLAEEYGCAVVLIRHLIKSGSNNLYRGMGSIDFSAAARSVLLAGKHPDIKDERVLAHVKSSLSKLGDSIGYKLKGEKFIWLGTQNVSANELITAQSEEEMSRLDEAKRFLEDAMEEGEIPASEVLKAANQVGISGATLFRARKALGIKSKRVGAKGIHGGGVWMLYYPKKQS